MLLGTPTTRELDELMLITKSVLSVLDIDTVPRRVDVFTDRLKVIGAGVTTSNGDVIPVLNDDCTTGGRGVTTTVGVGVDVGAGVLVAILMVTFCPKFWIPSGVAIGASVVGLGVGASDTGSTVMVNDLLLVCVITPLVLVANRVIVTDVGCVTTWLRTSIHQLLRLVEINRTVSPLPVTEQLPPVVL